MLGNMRKSIVMILLLCLSSMTINAQFLFRVIGNGQEKPSYMLGTVHTLPCSLLDSIPAYLEAETLCRQMYVEYDVNDRLAMDSLRNGDYDHFSTSAYFLSHAENDYALFRNRNEAWLPKMCVAMSEAPTMFVFGAGHLIGPHGMIQLLRNSGYHVDQIKDGLLTSYNE